MTDIIFHIGFPKCASSTFQNIVFPQTKGYLGAGKKTPQKHRYAKRFQRLAPCGPSLTGSLKQAQKWADEVIELKKVEFPGVNRVLLSSEFFVNRNKLRERPIIPFLKKFDDRIWYCGKVKVVVVLRNQADKLASGYAQISNIRPYASQSDFENYTDNYLNKYFHTMNYSVWIQELFDHFGSENVCVLLMEDIKRIEFWEKLKVFAELPEFDSGSMINSAGVNKRSSKKDTWSLQQYSPEYRAKVMSGNIFGALWPSHISGDFRKNLLEHSKTILSKAYSNNSEQVPANNKNEIYLSGEIKSKIKQTYSNSNKRLSHLLKRDLQDLGYL